MREREREQVGEEQRERETKNPKQALGSILSAQSPTRGSKWRTTGSWPELNLGAWATQVPLSWVLFLLKKRIPKKKYCDEISTILENKFLFDLSLCFSGLFEWTSTQTEEAAAGTNSLMSNSAESCYGVGEAPRSWLIHCRFPKEPLEEWVDQMSCRPAILWAILK